MSDVIVDLLKASEAAIECGMVPSMSARDGGAARHVRQLAVADQVRDAVARARSEIKSAANSIMDAMTPEQRLEVMARFCADCGTDTLPCHCMNDE